MGKLKLETHQSKVLILPHFLHVPVLKMIGRHLMRRNQRRNEAKVVPELWNPLIKMLNLITEVSQQVQNRIENSGSSSIP